MGKKSLAVKSKSDLAVPNYIKTGSSKGMENVKSNDIMLPRVKLLQPLSPEVVSGGKKAGLLVDSISGKLLGDGNEINFIAITHFKSRIMFDGVGQDAKMTCSSADGVKSNTGDKCQSCESGVWSTDKKGKSIRPACTEFYNFPILVLGDDLPQLVGLSMSRTKLKVAKKLLTMAKHAGSGLDLFALKFKLTTVKETANSNTYYNFDVEGNGFASEEEYAIAEKYYESFKNVAVKLDTDEDIAPAQTVTKTKKRI